LASERTCARGAELFRQIRNLLLVRAQALRRHDAIGALIGLHLVFGGANLRFEIGEFLADPTAVVLRLHARGDLILVVGVRHGIGETCGFLRL
jgi:hypothetical protein